MICVSSFGVFGLLTLHLNMPRRDDRDRSRTRRRRGRSESPPRKARRRHDRDEDQRQAESQDWLNPAMWQGPNGAASVPPPPPMPTARNRSMTYMHRAPAPFPPIPCLAPYPTASGLLLTHDPCHRALHAPPAHQHLPTPTTFANSTTPSSSARPFHIHECEEYWRLKLVGAGCDQEGLLQESIPLEG